MKRVSLLDVIRGRSPNKEAVLKKGQKASMKRKGEAMKAKTDKARRELSKQDTPTSMLKKGKRSGNADATTSQKSTKAGTYPVYKKKSDTAKSFRSAFAEARKSGKKVFTWNGRKYNTKVK
jgi:hypothetical protein